MQIAAWILTAASRFDGNPSPKEIFEILTSPGLLVPMVLLGLTLGALAYGVARYRGWDTFRSVSAVLCAVALAAVLSATLLNRMQDDWKRPFRHACDLTSGLIPNEAEALLNWVLLLPFTLFFVLATRRPLLACAAAIALTCTIEWAQSFFLLGGCQLSDIVSNISGGIAGALLGAAISAFRKRR